jgi:N-acetylated-alpha-linked acidic dipeptidase
MPAQPSLSIILRVALVTSVLAVGGIGATVAQNPQLMPGYTAVNAAAQRKIESDAAAVPSPTNAAEYARALSREPHMAGTPAQARTRDYVIDRMKSWGLETEVRAYDVWMPHPTSVHVWRVSPNARELSLTEGPVPGDSTSSLPEVPPVNGYGGAGDVTAEVVYVNYGLIEDYATLDSLGVSVRGKVAIARYGRSFRGIKAREAERHGAVALLIYSDPQDDGFVRGDVYPAGPMRPPQGIQRGSVFNGAGDPTTPGTPSKKGASRIPLAQSGVAKIPVVPISYGNATELLRDVRGTRIPQAWQGGLPFRYHVGPGPVTARVAVATDTATAPYKTIWNTFGIIRGSEFPDEMVVIGGHRDAWGPGAADNVSGTVSVLEAARAASELVKRGVRPKRTMVFATWDAEEWGLVGSTEYVEDDSLRLMRGAVAYLNQDVAAQGPRFGGGG